MNKHNQDYDSPDRGQAGRDSGRHLEARNV